MAKVQFPRSTSSAGEAVFQPVLPGEASLYAGVVGIEGRR